MKGAKLILARQFDELRQSLVLRIYGAALAGTHLFTAYYWLFRMGVARTLSDHLNPLCWPGYSSCEAYRMLGESGITRALLVYGLISLAAIVLFLVRVEIWIPWTALLTVTILKAALLFQDMRLWGNYHYMVAAVSVAYLVWPRKKELIPCLLVAFYLAAGSLKLGPEWLSGSIMGRQGPFHMPVRLLEWGCAYVVLLELAITPLILSGDRRVRLAVLAQLAVFHAISFYWVGVFYPVIMCFLLLIFPLSWTLDAYEKTTLYRLPLGSPAPSTWAALGLFALAQLAPYLFPGDSALTGEGRWFALNMYDARARCESLFLAHLRNGTTVEIAPELGGVGPREACDPLVYYDTARNLCRRAKGDPDFQDLDVQLISRRTTNPAAHRILAITGFCARNLSYSLFAHNDWIHPR